MNLYEIKFIHYAPKDSKEGTVCYLAAKDDEQVYEWMKRGIETFTGYEHSTTYEDSDYDNDMLDREPFKESIIESQGCANNEHIEPSDLYYGDTLYRWKLVKENISKDEIKVIEDIGVTMALTGKLN